MYWVCVCIIVSRLHVIEEENHFVLWQARCQGKELDILTLWESIVKIVSLAVLGAKNLFLRQKFSLHAGRTFIILLLFILNKILMFFVFYDIYYYYFIFLFINNNVPCCITTVQKLYCLFPLCFVPFLVLILFSLVSVLTTSG